MQFKLTDEDSRRNWTVCWKWALGILAAELIIVLIFANQRPTVSQVTPEATQTERLQPQRSRVGRGACRFVPPSAMRDI